MQLHAAVLLIMGTYKTRNGTEPGTEWNYNFNKLIIVINSY